MGNKVLFAIINPAEKMVSLVPCEKLNPDALKAAGLEGKGIDFGCIASKHSICVYEFGLLENPEDQHFFSFGRSLYAGNAVIFCEHDDGALADIDPVFYNELLDKISFYNSSEDVETAITANKITRPTLMVGADVLWAWPQSQ